MKRLIKGLLAITTLLLSSCGSDIVLTRKCIGVSIQIKDDPNYVWCELKENNMTSEKFEWEGIVDKWVIDRNLAYYVYYWCEYSNGTHIIQIGNRA